MSRRFLKPGTEVWLKAWPPRKAGGGQNRERATVEGDDGDTLIVRVDVTDPHDDGLREITRDQIAEVV